MKFELLSELYDVDTIAVNTSIRELARLKRQYGKYRWRKQKRTGKI